jgi:hypothetical protein
MDPRAALPTARKPLIEGPPQRRSYGPVRAAACAATVAAARPRGERLGEYAALREYACWTRAQSAMLVHLAGPPLPQSSNQSRLDHARPAWRSRGGVPRSSDRVAVGLGARPRDLRRGTEERVRARLHSTSCCTRTASADLRRHGGMPWARSPWAEQGALVCALGPRLGSATVERWCRWVVVRERGTGTRRRLASRRGAGAPTRLVPVVEPEAVTVPTGDAVAVVLSDSLVESEAWCVANSHARFGHRRQWSAWAPSRLVRLARCTATLVSAS